MHHLAGHPNVVALLDAFEDDDHVHLVTELCEGPCLLDAAVARGAPHPEGEAAALVRAVLRAVAYAHDMGVAHRDVKVRAIWMCCVCVCWCVLVCVGVCRCVLVCVGVCRCVLVCVAVSARGRGGGWLRRPHTKQEQNEPPAPRPPLPAHSSTT